MLRWLRLLRYFLNRNAKVLLKTSENTQCSMRPDGNPIKPDAKTIIHFPCLRSRFSLSPSHSLTLSPMHTLVFATHNVHKAREVEQILGPGFKIMTLRDIGQVEEIPETADTLEGNALLKARFVREKYGYDCFSEDTGLEVLSNLAGQPNRQARFRTIIALVVGETEVLLEGICAGRIALGKQGTGGFGYDPVFMPDGYEQTFAELGEEVKNQISHRAEATRKLIQALVYEG